MAMRLTRMRFVGEDGIAVGELAGRVTCYGTG
jgi:hypothetical protein